MRESHPTAKFSSHLRQSCTKCSVTLINFKKKHTWVHFDIFAKSKTWYITKCETFGCGYVVFPFEHNNSSFLFVVVAKIHSETPETQCDQMREAWLKIHLCRIKISNGERRVPISREIAIGSTLRWFEDGTMSTVCVLIKLNFTTCGGRTRETH